MIVELNNCKADVVAQYLGCGMRIRADDPTAMKNFVVSVQNRVNELKAAPAGEKKDLNSKRVGSFSFVSKVERKTQPFFVYCFWFCWIYIHRWSSCWKLFVI